MSYCKTVCNASECECQDAVDTINHLWPPDSDYSDCAATGRQDMLDALAAEWRSLPLKVLQHMARRQRARDSR